MSANSFDLDNISVFFFMGSSFKFNRICFSLFLFFSLSYCVDCLKCDNIVPLVAAAMRGFFGEIFFWAGCKRLRSFRKSANWKQIRLLVVETLIVFIDFIVNFHFIIDPYFAMHFSNKIDGTEIFRIGKCARRQEK